ncbi:MAG: alkaline phosphatase, partial [Polymorphobacter sp.]
MHRKLALTALLLGLAASVRAEADMSNPASSDPYWTLGRKALAARLQAMNRPARARNVILFIGDGMGISTITAARIFDAQQRAKASGATALGEENSLSFEKLPFSALVKTYNTDAQVPDSAGTASAMNIGIKTRIGYINFRQDQTAQACKTPEAWPRTIAEFAKGKGMAVGVVTNTRLTHATPAAVYAHVPNRNWEGADATFPAAARTAGCPDIASQLVNFGTSNGIDLALGGGRSKFQSVALGGSRDDGRDLVAEWRA